MRKLILPLASLFLLATAVSSCEKKTSTSTDLSDTLNYAHLEIGKYVLYNVDSIYWNDALRTQVVRRMQMRYEVADTFRDAENRLSYKINVLYRADGEHVYREHDVIYMTKTDTRLEVVQKNVRHIKLTFPVVEGNTWNGNAMIPLNDADFEEYNNPNWKYTYESVGLPFDPGNNFHETTVTVNHIDDILNDPDEDSTAYAFRNYSQEVYAMGVGMIYRERVYWVFMPNHGSQGGGSGYRRGYQVIMRAIENN